MAAFMKPRGPDACSGKEVWHAAQDIRPQRVTTGIQMNEIRLVVKLGIQRGLSRKRNAVEANGVAASNTAEWSLPGIIHNSASGIDCMDEPCGIAGIKDQLTPIQGRRSEPSR